MPKVPTPKVPFCPVPVMATAVVLSRCSVPDRVRSIADSGAAGGTHGTGRRARFSMLCGRGQTAYVLAPVAAPGTAHRGVWKTLTGHQPLSLHIGQDGHGD
jgi:hypothetical protein